MHILGAGRALPRWRRARRGRLGAATYWSLAAGLALATGSAAAGGLSAASTAADRWEAAPAAVARRHLSVGTVVEPSDVEIRPVPASARPDGALPTVPAGRTVRADVVAGEVLVDARLSPDGASGVSALATADRRVVAVPAGPARLEVQPGDRVDLVAVDRTTGAGSGRTVAADAPVVAYDDEDGSMGVAVRTEELAEVSAGLVDGIVVVALLGRS